MYSCHGVYKLNQQTYHDWGPHRENLRHHALWGSPESLNSRIIPVDVIGHRPIHPDILHVV